MSRGKPGHRLIPDSRYDSGISIDTQFHVDFRKIGN